MVNIVDILAARLEHKIEQKGMAAEAHLAGLGVITSDDLEGLGFSLKKMVKKAVGGAKQAVKAQVNVAKKVANISRLAVTHPRQAIKETVKLEKSAVRNTVKAGRDVAPAAAVAAAIYFGGPAALQYLQSTGASSILGGATSLLKTAGVVQQLQALKAANPQAVEELQALPPDKMMNSSLINSAVGTLTEQAMYNQTGYEMASPEAQQLTNAVAQEGIDTAAAAAQQPKSDAGKLLAWGVPLAILAKIALV